MLPSLFLHSAMCRIDPAARVSEVNPTVSPYIHTRNSVMHTSTTKSWKCSRFNARYETVEVMTRTSGAQHIKRPTEKAHRIVGQ